MKKYFSENELSELDQIKNDILINTQEYFFKNLRDFSEFKEIVKQMATLQWHYLKSGINLIINFIKYISNAIYSSITFDFFSASKTFSLAMQAVLASVIMLSLDSTLLLLHLTRLLTLFTTEYLYGIVFSASTIAAIGLLSGEITLGIAIVVTAITAYCFISALVTLINKFCKTAVGNQPDKKPVWLENIEKYEHIAEEIYSERRQVIEKINGISKIKPISNNPKFFSSNINSQELSHEFYDFRELISELFTLISSYPQFLSERAINEPDYVTNMQLDMEEHHLTTMQLANVLFSKVDEFERTTQKINVINNNLSISLLT